MLRYIFFAIHPAYQRMLYMYINMCYAQGPASTRYSTRTRNFLSYSNSTRSKHYSDRVVSSINSGNFNNYSEAARRYFRIITANPDIQMQPSMEKMSSDLNVKKRMFPSCTSCILKITWHTSLSPHAHALQQPQVCLDDDQILHLCRFSIDYVKTWNHWFQLIILNFCSINLLWEQACPLRGDGVSTSREDPLTLWYFLFNTFPFLSDVMIKHNSRANFELF